MIVAAILVAVEPRESPEFVVSVLALIVGGLFAGLVLALARRAQPRLPRGDKPAARVDSSRQRDRRKLG